MLYKILNHTGINMKFWPSEEGRETIMSLLDDPRFLPSIDKGKQPEKTLLSGRGRMSYASPTSSGRRMVMQIYFP